uniref:F-box domain-containing protein n=1 Tax=Psilocybe cubensis TaxID=181762 RepID=A0A8H7XQ75_PSICU
MAPKVNKRAKISAKSKPSVAGPISTGLGLQVDATFPIKKSKALQLPLELLLEIVTYFNAFPSEPVGFYDRRYFDREASKYLERTDALRSLSQTCRLWRYIFLPLLWERLDVLATHSESGAWYQVFGETLIRKCFLVTENRDIASHVRSVSVVLSRYSASTVLPAFVRGIEALPNLKTLYIATAHDKMSTALKTAFDGHVFSQIETAMLPTYAHNILRSCPEVKKVVCVDFMDASKLISANAKCCKKVEEIEQFAFEGERQMRRLVKAAPNLRSIKFQRSIDVVSQLHYLIYSPY